MKSEEQSKAFEILLEKSSNAVLIIHDNKFIRCNESAVKIFGCDSIEELLSKQPLELSPEYQPDGLESPQKAKDMITIAKEQGVHNFEWIYIKAEEEELWADITLIPISLVDKDMIHVSIRDISQQKKIQQDLINQKVELHHRANHDSLTKLPNRALFHDRLAQSVKISDRQCKKFAVLFIDLDRFKQINDSLGHAVGDKVLREIANRLKSLIRTEDTLARLGGDEFTILMQELRNGEDAALIAQKVIEIASEPIYIDEHTLYVSTSIGISLYPKDGNDCDALLMYADNAMYKAKDEGRNNYQFYSSEMTAIALSKVVMESNMRSAIENEEFVLYYQPQINTAGNMVTGMEALVRWEHPTKGLISPFNFIPLAEDTGLIVELDKLVMRTAMKQFKSWYEEGLNPGVLALNLSVKLLQTKDFVDSVKGFMTDTGFKAEWLEMEVTESQIMVDPENAISTLKEISDMGIELAIDDFGTGYSSLSYLKRLPIDKLKIDRSFISDIPDDEDDMAITRAIIALARSLNLRVIAEGVETKEQKEFLVYNGCENIQGYLYSKPIPADEMKSFLLSQDNLKSI